MAKTLTESPLTTRSARAKLPPGLHWRGIDPDVHLGYRRGKRGGTWLVRWRVGSGYRQKRLGTADDAVAQGTLSFEGAVGAARASVTEARVEETARSIGPTLTVRSAVENYIAERDSRASAHKGKVVRSDAAHRLERYVIGREARGRRSPVAPAPIAEVALHDLDDDQIIAWREALPQSLKRTTQHRLSSDLKASLNAAYARHRKRLPLALSVAIKDGFAVSATVSDVIDEVARQNQILTDDRVRNVVSAAFTVDQSDGWEGDFHQLILLMAATGARFSQIARLRVADVQFDKRRLMMPTSRKGRGSKLAGTAVPVGDDVLKVLREVVSDRAANEPVLMRWRYRQLAGGVKWERAERGCWMTASEIVRPWDKVRTLAQLDQSVVPYALRHSSIVRGIRAGLPTRLIAALHDTSVAMIERHYGRWIADGLDDLAAGAVVPLLSGREANG